MKRFLLLTIVLLGVASLTMFVGCSDDDNPVSLQQGDTTDASFQFVESILNPDEATDFGTTFEVGFALLEGSGIMGASAVKNSPLMALQSGDEIYITSVDTFYFASGNWFVFAFSAQEINGSDTASFSGYDSLQLLLDGVSLDTLTIANGFNALKTRVHVTGSNNTGDSFGAHHRLDAEVVDIIEADSVIRIDGSQNDTIQTTIESDSATCNLTITENSSINNYTFLNIGNADVEDCPQSGSITVGATLNLSCTGGDSYLDSLNINGTWTLSITINNNNTATITYTDGTTIWTITEDLDCSYPT